MPPTDRYRDGLQEGAELADKGQQDGGDRGPGHDAGVEDLGQGHSAGDFGVGGVGRAAEDRGQGGGQAVAQQRAVDARVLQIVLAGDGADGQDVAEVLDGRGDGHGHDEQDGLQVPGGQGEVRPGDPGRGRDLLHGDQAEERGQHVAEDDADDDRDELDEALGPQADQYGHQQRQHGDDQGRILGHEHGRAVAGLAQGHVHRHRREDEADDHDHRAGDDGRQDLLQHAYAVFLDEQAQDHVDHAGRGQAAERAGDAPGLGAVDHGRDEGKRGGQEDRHLALGDELEQEGARAGGEQGHAGVEAGQERHQDQGAEGHEEHLGAKHAVSEAEAVVGGGEAHAGSSFARRCAEKKAGSPAYLVPKILSPASPRPGRM